ncbi:MAG: GNAT family N-acetyltransferase [Patescibacteria group bacterium]
MTQNKFLQNLSNNIKPIKLGDVILVPLEQKHLSFYYKLYSSPTTVKYQRVNRCQNLNEAKKQLALRLWRRKRGRTFYWLIKYRGKLVGGFSVNRINYQKQFFSIGIAVLNKFAGQGIATKVVRRFTRYAFNNLKPTVIKANCAGDNSAIQKVLLGGGFTRYLSRKQGMKIDQKWHCAHFYHLPRP